MYYVLMTLLIFVAFLLILLILIQKGRGGGLSSAFGGGGGSAAFGAKTGDVLTWLTSGFFAVFILLAVILDLVVNSQYKLTVPIVKPGAAAASPTAMTDMPITPPESLPTPILTPTTAPAAAKPTLAVPPVPNEGLPNPAAQLGNALDKALEKKLHQATTTAAPNVNAATQKTVDQGQKLLNQIPPTLKPTTQPK